MMQALQVFGGVIAGYSLAMTEHGSSGWPVGTVIGALLILASAGIEVATRK
ncbi:hypothetical protein PUR29_34665 [Methylobacterium ajmalii]|uniref:Major facilitator superfamily (MFS) profile domain-containing protein n=1 Tax=Methylobacterium ajmalii TaxID=2738439 RepID=A0ABV0A747_9HYPH